jgi:uncharacterized delta-60 repeat protein
MKITKIGPFHKSILIAICLALMIYSVVLAASGDLDTNFSGDGKIIQSFEGISQSGYDVAVQTDGKVVVVGSRSNRSPDVDIVIARYNMDGSLDTTFSRDGLQVIKIGESTSTASSVAIQADGKIIIGGDTCVGIACDLVLVRLNPNGSLDPSFGHGGMVTTDVSGKMNGCADVVVQGNRIVVAGYVADTEKDTQENVVYRYRMNGSLDATFNMDGILLFHFGRYNNLSALKIYSGKIYVTGSTSMNGVGDDIVVARINNNGFLDPTFGDNGKVQTNLGGADFATDLVVFNGKVIVVGGSYDAFNSKLAIIQYTAAGDLDPAFGRNGILKASLGFSGPFLQGVVVRDGKILAVGQTANLNDPSDALLVRFDATGNLDDSFGTGGIVTTNWNAAAVYNSIAFKGDRIYAVGETFSPTGRWKFVVAAYKP